MPLPDSTDFLLSLDVPFTAEALFDRMTDTVFFIKDHRGRYLCVNDTLVARTGKRSKSDIVGLAAAELFGVELGNAFAAQDLEVIATGAALADQLELHIRADGSTGWCLTTKVPLFDRAGKTVGLAGISRDVSVPDIGNTDYARVSKAVEFARSRLSHPPSLSELADVAGMSTYRLDRRMKKIFGLTTGQWLLKTRFEHACERLWHGNDSIMDIALECGYANQSSFSRQFRHMTAMTPAEFRRLNDPGG